MRNELKTARAVDPVARKATIALIRLLRDGMITNDHFSDHWPQDSHDPAIKDICGAIWMTYDDMRTYRLEGADRLKPDQVVGYNRCILFLASGLGYAPLHLHSWIDRLFARLRGSPIARQEANPAWPFPGRTVYERFLTQLDRASATAKGVVEEWELLCSWEGGCGSGVPDAQ